LLGAYVPGAHSRQLSALLPPNCPAAHAEVARKHAVAPGLLQKLAAHGAHDAAPLAAE
jgi:hypothetical protein